MSARSVVARKPSASMAVVVDVVLFTPRDGALAVLVLPAPARPRSRTRWVLPSDAVLPEESLGDAAVRISRDTLGASPSFLEQAIADVGPRNAGDRNDVVVTYFGLVPGSTSPSLNGAWIPTTDITALSPRQAAGLEAAILAMRTRVDQQPIAFRLLPPTFTLSELQSIYELLLGRRLHKASFRRSLHASALVEATDEWRSEGRGRPAQLFRYAPPRRRRRRRGIRFDLLS